jgi:hypothetical protein
MEREPGGKTPAAVQEPVVPLGALQQFLAAIRARDFEGAKALAFQSTLAARSSSEHSASHLLSRLSVLSCSIDRRAEQRDRPYIPAAD